LRISRRAPQAIARMPGALRPKRRIRASSSLAC
jgi:hypothetical protein